MFSPGSYIHPSAREIVYNVQTFFCKEAEITKRGELAPNHINKVVQRVSNATGVSIETVMKIYKRSINDSSSSKEHSQKYVELNMDEFDYQSIRHHIYDLQENTDMSVSLITVLNKVKEELGYKGGQQDLNNIIKRLGMFLKTEDSKELILENDRLKFKRNIYIQRVKTMRSEKRNVVYIGNNCLNANPVSRDLESTAIGDVQQQNPKINTVHLLAAVNEKGFLPNTLLMVDSQNYASSIGYNMQPKSLDIWLTTQLIPNLVQNSIIIITAPYYINVDIAPPSEDDSKENMLLWLREFHNMDIEHLEVKSASELYHIIKEELKMHQEFTIYKRITDSGHSVLCLPQYHPELNPAARVLAEIKINLESQYSNYDLLLLRKILLEQVEGCTYNDWSNIYNNVIKCENDLENMYPPEYDPLAVDPLKVKVEDDIKLET